MSKVYIAVSENYTSETKISVHKTYDGALRGLVSFVEPAEYKRFAGSVKKGSGEDGPGLDGDPKEVLEFLYGRPSRSDEMTIYWIAIPSVYIMTSELQD